MLSLTAVNAFYGRAQALTEVALTVAAGEAVALVGRNGAGKSTLLKTIIGLVRPTVGTIVFDGHDITRAPAHLAAQLGIGYVPEERRIFAGLSVGENLEVGRQSPRPGPPRPLVDLAPALDSPKPPTGRKRWTLERVLALFPALQPLLNRRGDTLSGGEAQMLAIARTLMGNPRLLLLDEPAEGLAPLVVEDTVKAIQAIKAEGVAILLSEQHPAFGAGMIDRAYAIERGHVHPLPS
ncbi:MAG TPA: ABC transporter ATP-binding protein [Patescibacteria group bacterium]|nr:ABC transporter ATP-binding protein [Patescibacteria group bacterium]